LKASAPPRIPLSSSTGARPSTASRISGSVEGGDRAVDLALAVVRHDDSVHAVVERALGVLAVEDALERTIGSRVRSRRKGRSSQVSDGRE